VDFSRLLNKITVEARLVLRLMITCITPGTSPQVRGSGNRVIPGQILPFVTFGGDLVDDPPAPHAVKVIRAIH
jgi:hypothetical protein